MLRVPTTKCLGAIALFGILLSLSNAGRSIQQAGRSVALLAGGAATATVLKGSDCRVERDALARQWVYLEGLEQERQYLLWELYESAIAETELNTRLSELQAGLQDEVAEGRSRIAELENKLEEKTHLATQMLTELEAEATNTFQQFNAKITAQDNVINNLQQQIAALRAENAALSAQQTEALFANVGSNRLTNNPVASNHVLKQLARN